MGFADEIMYNVSQKHPAPTGPGYKQAGENVPAGYRKYGVKQFNEGQENLLNQGMNYLGPNSDLSRMASGDQSFYDQMEAPALRQFSELQGGLASRFSGGGLGGRQGSGFQNASTAAAQDFAGQLQSQRQGLQRQALQDLMSYSNMLMGQRPYDIGLAQKSQKPPSFLQGLGMNFANSAAKSAGETAGKAGMNWMMS